MPLTPEQFETLIDAANEAWNEKVTLQSILTAILPLHRAMVIEECGKPNKHGLSFVEIDALSSAYYAPIDNCPNAKFLTNYHHELAKGAFRSLCARGFVSYIRGLFRDDGMVCGSGYAITTEGKAIFEDVQAIRALATQEIKP